MHVFTYQPDGGGVGCCFPSQFSSLGVWEALGGSVSAQGVMLLIPGLLDKGG